MDRPRRILLFDLDGVLITLGGYHRALQETVNFHTRQMGLGDLAPDEPVIDILETGGLTIEWDSSAICLAILVTDLWRRDRELRLPNTWEGIVSAVRARSNRARPQPDYRGWAEKISAAVSRGKHAPQAALDLLLLGSRATGSSRRSEELRTALGIVLGQTRDFQRSVTMRVFQHFTLGSEGFRRTYGQVPSFETPSLLEEHDCSILTPRKTRELASVTQGEDTRAAVFTLRLTRPALPSATGGEYAPEGELALGRVGLSGWPIVGFGQMRWLAGVRNVHPDSYIKPSPVHALAAVARALGAANRDALQAACRLWEDDELTGALRNLRDEELALHVFEDSASSLHGAERAVELLCNHGARVDFRPWGIGSTPRRSQRLKDFGFPVFEEVGQALEESGILARRTS